MSQASNPAVTSSPPPKDDNLKELTFYDRDVDIHDPILSTQSMYQAMTMVMEGVATIGDILNLFHSNLVKEVVPQTYNFPDMVQW